jgi:hypothetical protein
VYIQQVLDDPNQHRMNNTSTRRWVYCGVMVLAVVVLAIVLGLSVGPRGDGTDPNEAKELTDPSSQASSNPVTVAPSPSPTEGIPINSLACDAKVIEMGDHITGGSFVGYSIMPVSLAPAPAPSGAGFDDYDSNNAVWGDKFGCHGAYNPRNPLYCSVKAINYYFRGTGLPVRAKLRGSCEIDDCASSLQVYKINGENQRQYCSFACLINDVVYPEINSVAWIAESDAEYLIQVSGAYDHMSFDLEVSTNDERRNAYGPMIPAVNDTIIPGTTTTATMDPEAQACGTATASTAPGVWYSVMGNGKVITASTCGLASGFDTQISVFKGLTTLQCVNGNDDSCGKGSLVAWSSEVNEVYYVLVHGAEGASGNFFLLLNTEGTAVVPGDMCATAPLIKLGKPTPFPLTLATKESDTSSFCQHCIGIHFYADFCAASGCYEPGGIWHKITAGSGNSTMSITLDCELSCQDVFLQISTGDSDCLNLSCTVEFYAPDCQEGSNSSSCQWSSEEDGQTYYAVVTYNAIVGFPPKSGKISMTVS